MKPGAFPDRCRLFVPRRGVALLLVLWGVGFLSALTVLLAVRMNEVMIGESRAEKMFRARQLALGGLAIGRHPDVLPGDPLLARGNPEATDSEGFLVSLSDDSGRINPNAWVSEREVLRALFTGWGHDLMEADAAIDSLSDWIDPDDLRSLAGAEAPEYARAGMEGLPRNAPLEDIREMASVLNLRDLLFGREGWRDTFTLWYDGPVNINHADPGLIALLSNLSERQIKSIVEFRVGIDGVEGTGDDGEFESMDGVRGITGASDAQMQSLEAVFGVTGSARRIRSTGFCHGARHTISAVTGGDGQILHWEEL
jgi:type II secretory pathway component PulK